MSRTRYLSRYRRRYRGYGGKPRFITHPMFRGIRLKPNFDVNSRVVSVDYFTTLISATDTPRAVILVTGDGFYSSEGRTGNQAPALNYFNNARFNSAASGFKEYTIVGVKVTFVPHRLVTASVGIMQFSYQSSIVSDHTDITSLNVVQITDQVALGKSKPKSYTPEEKLQRYMKFSYYVDSQFSKRYLKTTGGTAAGIDRQTWITDEEEEVPGILIVNQAQGNGI